MLNFFCLDMNNSEALDTKLWQEKEESLKKKHGDK